MSEELTIDQILRRRTAQTPNAIAVASPERKPLTYRGLIDQVDYVADFLAISGLTHKDCVAIVLPNGAEMAVAFLGVSYGAISTPLNPGYREAEFDFYLAELNARALIVQSGSDSPAITVAQKRNIPVIDLSPVVDGIAGLFHLRAEQVKGSSVVRRAEPTDVALILHTSGTTSRSKMVPLTHANLLASARNIANSLGLTADDRCLNVMPLFHIHGLVGALLSSLMAGSSVVCAPGFDGDNFFSLLETFHSSWYTAVPTIHQAVLASAQTKTHIASDCSLRFIRSSSSALSPQLMRGLENVFHVPVIEAYGMTEAAHQICSNPLPPGERKAGSVGLAAGPQVSIIDEDGRLLPSGKVGEVVIRGTNVMPGYANDSADSFTNGWFRTGDQGYLNDDGYLFITGRLKEIINRGGEKISPREIDDVLLEHPSIMEAVTFGISHATLGEDVATAVVLRKQVATTELELQQFVASRLADFKVPRQIIIVDAIPKAATGKVQRIGLAGKLGFIDRHEELATPRTVFDTPRTQTENTLTGIWSAVLGLDVGLEDKFFDLGGNSIHTAQIISRIRESLGVELTFPRFFEAPTVAAMARVIATASQKLRSMKALPFPEDGTGPLSFTQEALWFLDQLDPGNPAYNRPVFAQLEGDLKPSVLEKCISEIIRRHSSLRTHFPAEDGEATQRVYADQHISLPVMDIRRLPFREREAQLRKLTAEEARKPFDLAKGPTFRAKLVRVEERLHVLLATAHHIVIDGWSAEIFLQELQTLYEAFSTGLASPLADLSIQYLAFARWQRELADDELMKEHVDYWKRQLDPSIPPLNLITSRPRPPIQTFNGAKRLFTLSKDLLNGLKAISRHEGATLFMTLLSAFKTLLHHYSGQEDIIVGTPFAGRNQIHTEDMIGNFTTTLPLRTNLSGNPSFGELLARVRKTVQEEHAHQNNPFETIAPQLHLKRDSSRPPVYQVLFQLRNYPRDFRQSSDLLIEKYEYESEASAFDMSLSISEDRNGLKYDIVYNTDLFDDSTIERIAAQFDNLVTNIVANPGQKLCDFPCFIESEQRALKLAKLNDAEAQQVLAHGNNTETDYAKDRCVQELSEVRKDKSRATDFPRVTSILPPEQEAVRAKCLHPTGTFVEFAKEEIEQSIPERFEKIVRLYSDRLAVKDRHHSLTYEELNNAANRLTHAIIAQRRSDAEPIALLLEHGVPMITAILGTLKAGKIYVPLDPSHPPARLTAIVEDSQTALIVTNYKNLRLADELSHNKIKLINIDAIVNQFFDENLRLPLSPDASAYILYTSGSTGQPKGVLQNHRNVLHDCMSYTNNLHICAADRVGLLASCAVGASVHYLYGALLNGATLYPLDIREEGLSRLAAWLIQEKITFFQLSANVFRYFLKTLTGAEEFLDLRLIALGSARVTSKDVELYRQHFSPTCVLLNRLSTTESNTIRWHFIDKVLQISGDTLPVGYAVEDKEIMILDEAGSEVGRDEIGEIAIRSRYLAPGYWRRADLTQAKFLPDPKASDKRIYLTGDLGRLTFGGCLEHIGRKDLRIKIRGFTVEVAEIERALLEHPDIREVVVTASEDRRGDNQLVAYVVANSTRLTPTELRQFLRAKLPDYMVPTSFMILDSLPLNSNGKVDRQALPSLDLTMPQAEIAVVGATSPEEIDLAVIWAEVMCLNHTGAHDNFFDLGGHSLLAMEIICRIRDVFQIELALRDFFKNPTIAGVAEHISRRNGEKRAGAEMAIRPIVDDGQFPLSFAQESLWFLNQLQPEAAMYNEATGLRLEGALNMEALRKALDAIVDRHRALRTNVVSVDGNPLQVVVKRWSVELPEIDLSHLREVEQRTLFQRLASNAIQRPFNLCQDLMVRATLFRLGENDHTLLLVTHHIATDGRSDDIVCRDLATLYKDFLAGGGSTLPDLPIQYSDFVRWQRQRLEGEILAQTIAYWTEQLQGLPEPLELPSDRLRPTVQSFRGASESEMFSKTLTDDLRALARREGVTLFMLLLAAVQALLARLTGQIDIVVGSPIAGRSRSQFENLAGLFINTLILRADMSGDPSFRTLLERVREVALGAYDHQEVPFEKVMSQIQLKRSLSQNTLFQIIFAFRADPLEEIYESGELVINRFAVQKGTAKFDLNVAIYERADGLRCVFTYNTDLFDCSTVKRMIGNFRTLLEGIVSSPNERLSALPLLTNAERQQILVEWNNTRRDYPRDAIVHELFEAQVHRTPDAVAMKFEEQEFTYRELNRQSNQLAHHLQKLGVGPEVLVGLHMERSPGMIIALLAILKAGGAYVPLDPNYPFERLALILKDSQIRFVLSQHDLPESLGKLASTVIHPASEWDILSDESEETPTTELTPDNFAYVIYTSGSTGRPKGVGITHRALTNFATYAANAFELEPNDCVLQFASLNFDTAVEEIFPCLLRGGTLVLRTESMLDSASVFLQRCRDWNISVLDLPTAYWHELTASLFSEQLTIPERLRLVIIGGEKAIRERLTQWQEAVGSSVRLLNTYGPTEGTVVATMWEAPSHTDVDSSVRIVPIGLPICNVSTYILDRDLNPVPVGTHGELYIGGAGLARGYVASPDTTAETFVPDPFSSHPGERLYKTGDLVRHLPDGNIEFLRRLDGQIKIRGFRVETGEIETVLRQHPAVGDAVVMAREDVPGDKQLSAYIISDQPAASLIGELRDFLKKKLPNYMLPYAFVFLDSLPLTANGKIDRRSLPVPDPTRPDLKDTFMAPRTQLEKQIVAIWAEVLKLERVGIHDDFFDLGGHSLLAIRVISRVREAFQTEVPLRSLFEMPTVAGLASVINKDKDGGTASPVPKISSVSRQQYRVKLSSRPSGNGSNV